MSEGFGKQKNSILPVGIQSRDGPVRSLSTILTTTSGILSCNFFIFLFNAPHVLDGLRGLPSWGWQKCNRLLRLGRP